MPRAGKHSGQLICGGLRWAARPFALGTRAVRHCVRAAGNDPWRLSTKHGSYQSTKYSRRCGGTWGMRGPVVPWYGALIRPLITITVMITATGNVLIAPRYLGR